MSTFATERPAYRRTASCEGKPEFVGCPNIYTVAIKDKYVVRNLTVSSSTVLSHSLLVYQSNVLLLCTQRVYNFVWVAFFVVWFVDVVICLIVRPVGEDWFAYAPATTPSVGWWTYRCDLCDLPFCKRRNRNVFFLLFRFVPLVHLIFLNDLLK